MYKIQEYNYSIDAIEKGRYTLAGEEVRLIPVFEAVNGRMQKASRLLVTDKINLCSMNCYYNAP